MLLSNDFDRYVISAPEPAIHQVASRRRKDGKNCQPGNKLGRPRFATINRWNGKLLTPDRGRRQEANIADSDLLTGQMLRTCVLAGLTRQDAEDVAQDIWVWLVESNSLAMITLAPWVSAVLENFILRFRRRRWRTNRLFVTSDEPYSDCSASRTTEPAATEAKLFLERLAARLPARERRLLENMKAGDRLSEAARRAGIVHGSEQCHLGRIRDWARRLEQPNRL